MVLMGQGSCINASDTIFIDPSLISPKTETGTFKNPFTSWSKVNFKAGNTYAQKRGTKDTVDHLFLNAGNIVLTCYGTGNIPVIFCNTKQRKSAISCWKLSGIKLQNLEIIAPYATSCIYFNHGNSNHVIDSCILHESQWGIRITSGKNSGHKILNSEIYNITDDGIFIQDAHKIEVAYCYVHHVNTKWKSPDTSEKIAPGDGVQFSRCNYWHVHHNLIDRRSSGNKFCFISNNPDQTDGILEHNIFYCPAINGSCVYFHNGSGIHVRYNYFFGNNTATAIYHRSRNLEVYYNVFSTFKSAVVSLDESQCIVTNNTFFDVKYGLKGKNFKSVNNLFDIKNVSQVPHFKVKSIEVKNNHYTSGNYKGKASRGEPGFKNNKKGAFMLKTGSPCIDKGVSTKYLYDIQGNKVPNGSKPDIGAFEYYEIKN
jgi:hypothetical protein